MFAIRTTVIGHQRDASVELAGSVDVDQRGGRVGEGAGVSPLLVSRFDDDLGAGVLRATHQLVDSGIGGRPDHDQTLMRIPRRSFAITDHPPEAARRNRHHTQSDADLELQGLG